MATNNFTTPFFFTYNDYDFEEYADVDNEFIDAVTKINIRKMHNAFAVTCKDPSYASTLFFSENRINLKNDSDEVDGFMAFKNSKNYLEIMKEALKYNPGANPEEGEYPFDPWLMTHSFFVRTDFLYDILNFSGMKKTGFTINLKRSYPRSDIEKLYGNFTYILVHFDGDGNLKINSKGL